MITKGIGQETSLSKQNKDMGLLTSGQMALGSHELFNLTCFYLYPHHLGGCGTDQPFQDLSTQRHVRFMWNFTGNKLVWMQLVENALGAYLLPIMQRGAWPGGGHMAVEGKSDAWSRQREGSSTWVYYPASLSGKIRSGQGLLLCRKGG